MLSPDIIELNDREPILQIAAIKMASKMAARAFSRCNKAQWSARVSMSKNGNRYLAKIDIWHNSNLWSEVGAAANG